MNKATTTPDSKTTTTTKNDTKSNTNNPHQAHVTIKSTNNEQRLHWANQASHNSQPFSHMSEWLIDSGCSNHMTPYENDLIYNISSSRSLVEVANGNIVKAPKRGTVDICITDVKTMKTQNIHLESVLYVPGLTRRLFSVTQWTDSGGTMIFNGDLCTMSLPNTFSLQLHAPFSP